MLYGYAESRTILKNYRPDLVIGVGGYASLPVVLASKGLDIPCYIHEQNAIPGKANKVLAQFSRQVFIALDEAQRYFPEDKTIRTGNPLRRQILEALHEVSPSSGQAPSSAILRLFIFGGSQGARAINNALPEAILALPETLRTRISIVHQTGEQDEATVRARYLAGGIQAQVMPFIDNMAAHYALADLIICRAGATTIAEVTAMGKACLFIPFPHATDDHQRKNAEALLKQHACEMVIEQEIAKGVLQNRLETLLSTPDLLESLRINAKRLGQIDAASLIVDLMLKDMPCTEK